MDVTLRITRADGKTEDDHARLPHRYAGRGRVLQPRRHPALRAAQPDEGGVALASSPGRIQCAPGDHDIGRDPARMDERPYPERVDCCWLAIRPRRPHGCLRDQGTRPDSGAGAARDRILSTASKRQILALPKASDIDLRVRMPRPDRLVALAERGFFVYDWSDVHRTEQYIDEYELMALPYRPLTLDLLPESLSDTARAVRFSTVSFASRMARRCPRAHGLPRSAS